MEEQLNERWEFYYDNRLKHPSEEQEESIRQIDFHKIIKSDGVMYLLTLTTKILEKAKAFSKDGSFNFSYIYAARAEKVVEKIKRTAPSLVSKETYKRLYLKLLETCHDFKNKAKENIMESLKDDLLSERARITEQEKRIRSIEQKIGLDAASESTKVYGADTGEGYDFDDAYLYDDIEPVKDIAVETIKVHDVLASEGGREPVKAVINDSVDGLATVVVSTNENSNVNVVPVEPDSITLDDVGGVENVLVVEDTNVLEINPDAMPDGVEAIPTDSNNTGYVDAVVATTINEYDGQNQNAITACILDTQETHTEAPEERFDISAFSNLYPSNLNKKGVAATSADRPVVLAATVSDAKPKRVAEAKFVQSPTKPDVNKQNGNSGDKFVVKPIEVIERIKWRVGDMVDIEDVYMSKQGAGVLRKWRKGQIISIKDNRRVKVRYIEPPFNKPKWDENIDMTFEKQKRRIAAPGTHTRSLDLQWMSKSERFKVGMRNNGYSIYQMRGDGNCLFRSVAHQIWNDAERHADLRRAVCDHMLQNSGQFAEVLGALMPGPNGFARYVERMRRPCYGGQGEWGGDPEIRVMEELLDRPIEVWDVESGPEAPSNIHLEGSLPDYVLNEIAPIRISYHGKNHYNSVIYDKDIHKYPYGVPSTTYIRDFRKKIEQEEKTRDRRLKNGYK